MYEPVYGDDGKIESCTNVGCNLKPNTLNPKSLTRRHE